MQADTNYIYILLAVVYVIYSIIKAGKKVTKNRPTINKQPQSSPTVQPPASSPLPEQNKEDDFKKMLEDLLGGSPEIEIPEKQVPKVKPQPIPIKPLLAKIAPHHPKKEKLTTSQAKFVSAKPKTTSGEVPFIPHSDIAQKVFAEPIIEEESRVDFDIRQAIIYSEILKRPQY